MAKNPPLGNQKWSHPPPDGSIIGKQNRFCLTARLATPILIHKRPGGQVLISLTLILSVRMLHPYPLVKFPRQTVWQQQNDLWASLQHHFCSSFNIIRNYYDI